MTIPLEQTVSVADEEAMVALGRRLGAMLYPGFIVFLRGDLGAGKTTLVRGVLQYLGHDGAVTSPTFTLVESYETDAYRLFHFDLYRLDSEPELEAIGLRDMLDDQAICLFEWPEQAAGLLPQANLVVDIQFADSGRNVKLFVPSTASV